MARNKAYDIIHFEGGMNNHADARDIEDNQVAWLANLIVNNKGVVSMGYAPSNKDTNVYPVITPETPTLDIVGKNVWSYNTDFQFNNVVGATEYIVYTDGKKFFRKENNVWVEIADIGYDSLKPSLVIYDGHLRVSDGELKASGSSPYLPSSKTQFFGQVRRKYFTEVVNSIYDQSGNTSVIKPTNGAIVFNKSIETAANNPTRGYLGLEVKKVEHTSLDKISFGASSVPTIVDTSGTSTESSSSAEYSEIGRTDLIIDVGTPANSTLLDVYANTSYTGTQTFGSTPTDVAFNGDYLSIGDDTNSTISSVCTFYISVDSSTFDGKEFGTTKRSIKFNGYFNQSDSTSLWSNLDNEPNIYPVADDGTVGSELSISDKDDNQTTHGTYRFDDTTKASKYKITIKAGDSEKIDLSGIQLFQSIQPITVDATTSRHERFRVESTDTSASFQIHNGLNNSAKAFNTSVQTVDRIVFMRVAIPSGNDDFTSKEYAPTNIEIRFEKDSNNYRKYELGPEWVAENKGKGWVELNIKLNDIVNITGTAAIGEIQHLNIKIYKTGQATNRKCDFYFAEYDEVNNIPKYDDPFLLVNCDFQRGARKPNSQSLSAWVASTATGHFTHSLLKFINPELSSTFSINSGYEYDPLNHVEEIRFRDAEVLNRRVYYGNVDIVWEKASGETNARYNRYGDRVYKSLPGKPDVVPSYNYLDIDINDGDEITALASYADRLLVFKKNMMYIVNATQQMEYLEDKHEYKGVVSNRGVTPTDIGIAWVNKDGAYHYDGEKVLDLITGKIKQSTFFSQVGGNPTIIYKSSDRHLIIYNKGSANGMLYDLDTGAWSRITNGVSGANDNTNFVISDDTVVIGSVESIVTWKEVAISISNTATVGYELKTKDLPLNEFGGKVDIKSIYLTYKGTMAAAGQVKVSYFPNKSSTAVNLVNGTLATSPSGYTTIKLTPNPKTSGRSVHTIQIRVYSAGTGGVGYRDFELHDISIVYREKSLK